MDSTGSDEESTRADSRASGNGKEKPRPKHDLSVPPLRWIVSGLRNLGWSATDAKERVLRAAEFFESQGKEPREEDLLKKALSLRL